MKKRIHRIKLTKSWHSVSESIETDSYGLAISNAANIASIFSFLKEETVEECWVALLNSKNKLLGISLVSRGSLTQSLVHPRETFCAAIHAQAAAIIAVHNHPSGDCEPSSDDLAVTKRLYKAGELLGIPLMDHVIIGDSFVSLRKMPQWPF
jgi:DNA repair protein RadC